MSYAYHNRFFINPEGYGGGAIKGSSSVEALLSAYISALETLKEEVVG